MAVLYADRARVYVNGVELLDVQDITVNLNDSTKMVPVMSSDRRNRGWTRGNREVTVTFSVAVQDKLASAKLENIDYDSQDVSLLFQQGADKYLVKSYCHNTMSQTASGVGTEAKKQYSGMAVDLVDMVGNSSLFQTSLSDLV